jgi:hypothetical protein
MSIPYIQKYTEGKIKVNTILHRTLTLGGSPPVQSYLEPTLLEIPGLEFHGWIRVRFSNHVGQTPIGLLVDPENTSKTFSIRKDACIEHTDARYVPENRRNTIYSKEFLTLLGRVQLERI